MNLKSVNSATTISLGLGRMYCGTLKSREQQFRAANDEYRDRDDGQHFAHRANARPGGQRGHAAGDADFA